MGRPINPRYFGLGEGKISVMFHNGTDVVAGYVVKQLGTRTFLVSDGTNQKTCVLARTTGEATALTGNLCTIEIETSGGTKYVDRLYMTKAVTTEGISFNWQQDEISSGEGKVKRVVPEDIGLPNSPEGFALLTDDLGNFVVDSNDDYIIGGL